MDRVSERRLRDAFADWNRPSPRFIARIPQLGGVANMGTTPPWCIFQVRPDRRSVAAQGVRKLVLWESRVRAVPSRQRNRKRERKRESRFYRSRSSLEHMGNAFQSRTSVQVHKNALPVEFPFTSWELTSWFLVTSQFSLACRVRVALTFFLHKCTL